jgi:soluble lytic murein transglycosylase-like protein
MSTRTKLLSTAAATLLAGAFTAGATGALADDGKRAGKADLKLLERPVDRLERSIDLHEEIQAKIERRREARREAREPEFKSPESFGVSSSTLEAIAGCESGGDPAAVSADGTYRGKYQFDSGTWASMGGSGDPAAAPEAEQDMRAAMLYAQSGSSPWPICGA